MAWALRAGSYANKGAGYTGVGSGTTQTLAVGTALSSGDLILFAIFAATINSGTTPTFAVSDSVNGAWGSAEAQTATSSSGTNNGRASIWLFPNTAAGTPTMTV